MKVPSTTNRRAFTLIELLVVISIIAILMTLLFPAVSSAIYAARKTQAKNDATQIATAINAYISEYGKMPTTNTGDSVDDQALMNTLAGAVTDQTNPRGIVFLEVPKAKSKKNGAESNGGTYSSGYYDPWGKVYNIRLDDDYDNVIKDGPDGDEIRKSVIVWSKGDPQRTKDYTDSSKWIKSWE
jgi:prepilin-type N-terminal cleavage/methylation domain-containing protein